MRLNRGAAALVGKMAEFADDLGIAVHTSADGGHWIDCGIDVRGGLEAGRLLAEVCLGGLGRVSLQRGDVTGQDVVVRTDHPVAACLGSQYAGWAISPEGAKYFAMGSGPMRAVANREPIIEACQCAESPTNDDAVIGVLETAQPPTADVFEYLAERCKAPAHMLTLLAAPTSSIAGAVQVVARSVETAMHKMHELGFNIDCVRHGFGAAPLPPVAADDLQGIGWTNDAILYGGEVTLWVECDTDEPLETLGPKIPSSASQDHGSPFAEIFRRYDGDFYKIDPHLFSPAVVHLHNLTTARRFSFGHFDYPLLRKSFGWEADQ